MLENLNYSLAKLKKEIDENKNIDMKNLRTVFLNNFFEELDPLILKSRTHKQYSYFLQFQAINTIRSTAHELENWNTNQTPFILNYKFGKETSGNVVLKNIYFLEENSGIILFSNSPDKKSSLLYFNISNKNNPLITPIMNLSSQNCDFIVEKNLNLWCIYDNKEKRFNMGKISGSNFDEGLPLSVYEIIHFDLSS